MRSLSCWSSLKVSSISFCWSLQDLAELVHLLAHLAVCLALLSLLRRPACRLFIIRCNSDSICWAGVAIAGACEVLDLVHHPFQILLTQELFCVLVRLHRRVLQALGKLLHIVLHRLAQFVHQLLDFRVGALRSSASARFCWASRSLRSASERSPSSMPRAISQR